ncbi:hypothetical protein F3Y22_tig00111566pilonHSYRG00207 [Hibiscus syriacus]|uniref:CCHC-type domain-containing protein n=1 Tax=Hibiscus syriacus TaxID=106335 RepID=A0A6A2Y155_HIBSY|nr:hypothetical protein F3Y22_tig00111566pilonHSYRG00207 [Hibiscus syriacus]
MKSCDPWPGEDLVSLEDEDFDLLEEDVCIGEYEGIPFINFSERIQALTLKNIEQTLVIKVLGRQISYNVLYARILNIWKPAHPLKLVDIENDHFMVKFSAHINYLKVLSDGPGRSSVTISRWNRGHLTSTLHNITRIDYQTDNGRHGRFARMEVSINLLKPLISKIVINGRTQLIEYESLPVVCFSCGIYGHTSCSCPQKETPTDAAVEKKKRLQNRKEVKHQQSLPSTAVTRMSTRFDPIAETLPESVEPAPSEAIQTPSSAQSPP